MSKAKRTSVDVLDTSKKNVADVKIASGQTALSESPKSKNPCVGSNVEGAFFEPEFDQSFDFCQIALYLKRDGLETDSYEKCILELQKFIGTTVVKVKQKMKDNIDDDLFSKNRTLEKTCKHLKEVYVGTAEALEILRKGDWSPSADERAKEERLFE